MALIIALNIVFSTLVIVGIVGSLLWSIASQERSRARVQLATAAPQPGRTHVALQPSPVQA